MFKLSPKFLCSYDQVITDPILPDPFHSFNITRPLSLIQYYQTPFTHSILPVPLHSFNITRPLALLQDTFNKIVSPHDILGFTEADLVSKVHVQNPVFDYVPPDLINLFISNM